MPRIAVPEGTNTKIFILDDNALPALPEVLQELWNGKRPWIIADGNTWNAAGEKVMKVLEAAGLAPHTPLILPAVPKPHPDYALAKEIAGAMPENAVPVAVGSGVINDLVKTASGLREIGYCCVPTASSVDGYTSNGAALSVDGFKKTVPCPAPLAVVADRGILFTAPPEMAAAGYADLVAKIPAGADWIIADALNEDPIAPAVWNIVQKDLRAWISDPGDLQSVFMGLAATGYAMQCYHDSRPASGAEHMFSHIWEMEGLRYKGEEVSHGFKVSVGSVASLRLMEFFLNTTLEDAKKLAEPPVSRAEREAETAELFKRNCYGDSPSTCALEKFRDPEATLERRAEIYAIWEELQQKLRNQLGDYENLIKVLESASCPTRPAEIGLSEEQFVHGIFTAQLIRKRYNILDLLYESGLLKAAVASLAKKL